MAAPVQFLSRGSGYALFLAPDEVVLNLERQPPAGGRARGAAPGDSLRMSLVGANQTASATGLVRQSGVVNYSIGNDPKQWRVNIPAAAQMESTLRAFVEFARMAEKRGSEADAMLSAIQIRRENSAVRASVAVTPEGFGELLQSLTR